MAQKKLYDEVLGEFSVVKRRGMKQLKLSVGHGGAIRVTMPIWVPLKHAKDFVVTQRPWLQNKRPDSFRLVDGAVVGRSHRLYVVKSPETVRIRTRLAEQSATIFVPKNVELTETAVLEAGQKLLIRALKKETEERIMPRIELLARSLDAPYKKLQIRHLRSRWGSCSSSNDITLSCFLAQLTDELVDYVLIHELAHTKVHAHSAIFWRLVETHDPNYKQHRKRLKDYRPTIALMA